MSKCWLRYLLPGVFLAALIITFVWMRLPQSFEKVIGFDETCTFYVQINDYEGGNFPPKQAAMIPLPVSLKDCTLYRWGYRCTMELAPGDREYSLRVHAYSPDGAWMGEVPVILSFGGVLHKPFGEKGYLWYGISGRDIEVVRKDLKELWSMA